MQDVRKNQSGPELHSGAAVVMSGLTLFALSLLLYGLLLENVHGAWVLDQPPQKATVAPEDKFVVGVVDSNVRRLWTPKRAKARTLTWTSFLDSINVKYRVYDPAAPGADLEGLHLLLFMTPLGMTEVEHLTIKEAHARGVGTLFAVNSDMTEDEGLVLQSDFWRRLLGTDRARVYEHKTRRFLPFRTDLRFPLSIAPGAGLEFDPGTMMITFSGREDPVSIDVRAGYSGKGRWAMLGFDPSSVSGRNNSSANASKVLIDAVQWLRLKPAVWFGTWPSGRRMATIFAVDLGDNLGATKTIDTTMKQLGLRPTYFSSANWASVEPPRSGELAVMGRNGRGPTGRWPLDELVRSQEGISKVGAHGVFGTGFAPVGGLYDDDLVSALSEYGYGYVYAPDPERRVVPRLWHPTPPWWQVIGSPTPIVLIPRTAEDDLGIYLETGDDDPGAVVDYYISQIARIRNFGGLLTITVHADFFDKPQAGVALRALAKELDDPYVWNATGQEVAHWWSRRGRTVMSVLSGPPHRVVFGLSNVSGESVEDLVVNVALPAGAREVSANITHWKGVSFESLIVQHEPGQDYVRLIIPPIASGVDQVVHLDWR